MPDSTWRDLEESAKPLDSFRKNSSRNFRLEAVSVLSPKVTADASRNNYQKGVKIRKAGLAVIGGNEEESEEEPRNLFFFCFLFLRCVLIDTICKWCISSSTFLFLSTTVGKKHEEDPVVFMFFSLPV